MSNSKSTIQAIGATILPNIGGWVAAYTNRKHVQTWYETLKRPSWTPPKYVFAPVWTTLYCGMGYASYLVWRDGGGFEGPAKTALAVYGTQLALNWAWSPIFFSCHNIKWALVDIILLAGTAGYCGLLFSKINQTAGLLFIPYMCWLSIATSLNFNIYVNNSKPSIKAA